MRKVTDDHDLWLLESKRRDYKADGESECSLFLLHKIQSCTKVKKVA